MARYETPLAVTLKGAMAGLVGTAALTVAMRRGPQLMAQLGVVPTVPQPRPQDRAAEEPTEKLAEKVAVGVVEQPLPEQTRAVAGQAIHWGYGALWGALFGIIQSSIRPPTLVHGTLFGTVVALVASTVVPAMHLTPPPTRQPLPMSLMQFGVHLLYGWVTALTFRVLSPGR